jgi:hypothetical protein
MEHDKSGYQESFFDRTANGNLNASEISAADDPPQRDQGNFDSVFSDADDPQDMSINGARRVIRQSWGTQGPPPKP